jgi:hypothetical protein
VDELAIIFNEIGIVKTGQILAKSEDSNFVSEVISEIKNKNGGYTPLNGNQTGVILTEYVLSTMNELKSLEGVADVIWENLYVGHNPFLNSLRGAPTKLLGYLSVSPSPVCRGLGKGTFLGSELHKYV